MLKNNEIKKYVIIIVIGALAYLVVNNLEQIINIIGIFFSVLSPFILGGVIAYILNIPMIKIESLLKNKIKSKSILRIISIILSLLLLVIIIAFIALLLIPELVENIKLLISNIPQLVGDIEIWILDLLNKYPDIQIKIEEAFAQATNINDIITNILNHIINGTVGFISGIVSSVITTFTSLIFAIYMLSQKEYLIKGMKKIIYAFASKKRANKIMEIGSLTNKIFSKFISGQCLEAVILGVLIFIALTIFKIPYALIISVLTAVTALIPVFGAFIAMIIGIFLIGITNPVQVFIYAIIFLVVQQIEGNFIYPKVVGKSVGLSPIWTLLAITIGGELFGVVGMIIGLPLASVIYTLIRSSVNTKLKEKKIKE